MTDARIMFSLRNSFSNLPKAKIGIAVSNIIKADKILVASVNLL